MTIIVTDCQYRMSAAVVRELGELGHDVVCVSAAGHTPIGAYSKHCKERFILGKDDYVQSLRRIINNIHGRPVLFPVGAFTSNALCSESLDDVCDYLVPTLDTLDTANDKGLIAAVAERAGVAVPKKLNLEDADSFAYPVVVKYRNGEGLGLKAAQRYKIVNSKAELDVAVEKMSPHPVIVSEYIKGDGWGVGVVMDKHRKPAAVFCHRRRREYPVSGGPSTCCVSVYNGMMIYDAIRILKEIDFTGVAMVEFKGFLDDYRLLEINPRVWGGFPLARLSGAGLAEAYINAAQGWPMSVPGKYKEGIKMRFLIQDTLAAAGYLKRGDLRTAGGYLKDLFDFRVKGGLLEWDDIMPAVRYLLK
jgi:predicted ATP-grasp superfamily ATP-dependent carboligase